MTATRPLLVLLVLLAAARSADAAGLASCDAAPHRAPTGSLLTARAAAAPEPCAAKKTKSAARATTAVPKSWQAAPTAADPMDMDSGFKLTHRQRLELAGFFAFGAGASLIMLIYGFIDFMRCAIRWLDRTLTNLYGDPNQARRGPGRTQANEGGAGVGGDSGADGRGG
jgi:hypothetical protein